MMLIVPPVLAEHNVADSLQPAEKEIKKIYIFHRRTVYIYIFAYSKWRPGEQAYMVVI